MGDLEDSELKPGTPIRLSALGRARSPRTKVQTGVILRLNQGSGGAWVLFDGRKMPIKVHQSYIEPQ